MKKVSINEGIAYEAKGHFDMRAIKLQSKPLTGCDHLSLGISEFLPGGGTEYLEPPVELIYFMLEGELTIYDKDKQELCTIKKDDSLHFAKGEGRIVLNNTNYPASMLVIACTE